MSDARPQEVVTAVHVPAGPAVPAAHPAQAPRCIFAEAAEALHPSRAPEVLPCREREQEQLTHFLQLCLLSGYPASVHVCGSAGVGKTAVISRVLRGLPAWARDHGLHAPGLHYVNGMTMDQNINKVQGMLQERMKAAERAAGYVHREPSASSAAASAAASASGAGSGGGGSGVKGKTRAQAWTAAAAQLGIKLPSANAPVPAKASASAAAASTDAASTAASSATGSTAAAASAVAGPTVAALPAATQEPPAKRAKLGTPSTSVSPAGSRSGSRSGSPMPPPALPSLPSLPRATSPIAAAAARAPSPSPAPASASALVPASVPAPAPAAAPTTVYAAVAAAAAGSFRPRTAAAAANVVAQRVQASLARSHNRSVDSKVAKALAFTKFTVRAGKKVSESSATTNSGLLRLSAVVTGHAGALPAAASPRTASASGSGGSSGSGRGRASTSPSMPRSRASASPSPLGRSSKMEAEEEAPVVASAAASDADALGVSSAAAVSLPAAAAAAATATAPTRLAGVKRGREAEAQPALQPSKKDSDDYDANTVAMSDEENEDKAVGAADEEEEEEEEDEAVPLPPSAKRTKAKAAAPKSKSKSTSSGSSSSSGTAVAATGPRGSMLHVVVLDEADALLSRGAEALYRLFAWPYDMSTGSPGSPGSRSRVILVALSNMVDLTARHLPMLRTVKQEPAVIVFEPYSAEQLATIARERLSRVCAAFPHLAPPAPPALPAPAQTPAAVSAPATAPAATAAATAAAAPTYSQQWLVEDHAVVMASKRIAGKDGDLRKVLFLLRQALIAASVRYCDPLEVKGEGDDDEDEDGFGGAGAGAGGASTAVHSTPSRSSTSSSDSSSSDLHTPTHSIAPAATERAASSAVLQATLMSLVDDTTDAHTAHSGGSGSSASSGGGASGRLEAVILSASNAGATDPSAAAAAAAASGGGGAPYAASWSRLQRPCRCCASYPQAMAAAAAASTTSTAPAATATAASSTAGGAASALASSGAGKAKAHYAVTLLDMMGLLKSAFDSRHVKALCALPRQAQVLVAVARGIAELDAKRRARDLLWSTAKKEGHGQSGTHDGAQMSFGVAATTIGAHKDKAGWLEALGLDGVASAREAVTLRSLQRAFTDLCRSKHLGSISNSEFVDLVDRLEADGLVSFTGKVNAKGEAGESGTGTGRGGGGSGMKGGRIRGVMGSVRGSSGRDDAGWLDRGLRINVLMADLDLAFSDKPFYQAIAQDVKSG